MLMIIKKLGTEAKPCERAQPSTRKIKNESSGKDNEYLIWEIIVDSIEGLLKISEETNCRITIDIHPKFKEPYLLLENEPKMKYRHQIDTNVR